jgi:hypothetical protein
MQAAGATPQGGERRAAWILAGVALAEGAWVVLNAWERPTAFIRYLGFAPGAAGTAAGWVLAILVVAGFVAASARLPSVRDNLVRMSWLKLLALVVAVVAGILEEVFFRKLLMDWLQGLPAGAVMQIAASGLAFGVAHGIWGLFGGARAALGATLATGALGAALAVVYVAADRSLAPCVFAHFLIDALIEPGLVLAAARGEMSARR